MNSILVYIDTQKLLSYTYIKYEYEESFIRIWMYVFYVGDMLDVFGPAFLGTRRPHGIPLPCQIQTIFPFTNPSIFPSTNPSIRPSIHFSIHQFIHSINPSINPPIHLSGRGRQRVRPGMRWLAPHPADNR